MWVGWLEEYPDYRTQGASLDELKENLKDIYMDLSTGEIPHVRKYGELVVRWKGKSSSGKSSKWDVFWFVTVVGMTGIKIGIPRFLNLFQDIAK